MSDKMERIWLNLCSFVLIPLMLLGIFLIVISPCLATAWVAWLIWGG